MIYRENYTTEPEVSRLPGAVREDIERMHYLLKSTKSRIDMLADIRATVAGLRIGGIKRSYLPLVAEIDEKTELLSCQLEAVRERLYELKTELTELLNFLNGGGCR